MPERRMVGIISSMAEISRAATCVRVTHEISRPSERDTKMKSRETPDRAVRLPAMGT